MGWTYCGKDSNGRDIGYGIQATCDYPGCNNKIDRGLAYACGGMHGQNEWDCEGYFCDKHLIYTEIIDEYNNSCLIKLCPTCSTEAEKSIKEKHYEEK